MPSFSQTSKLVAHALGVSVEALQAGFRRVTEDELPSIVEFRRRTLAERVQWDDLAYLRWRYCYESPGDEGGVFQPCELLQLKLGERLIGIVGREVLEARFNGRTLKGECGMDLAVDPEVDASGVGVWLNQANLQAHDFALAVGANEASLGLIKRLYTSMPPRKPYLLPIDFSTVLKRYEWPAAATALAGGVLNLAEPMLNRVRRPKARAALSLRPISRFTPTMVAPLRADQHRRTAEDRAGGHPPRVEIMRSAAALNWRLFDNPRARYDVLGAFEGDTCTGYIAFRTLPGRYDALAMHVIDWYASGGTEDDQDHDSAAQTFAHLLHQVVQRAREARCVAVQTVTRHEPSEAVLHRAGFLTGRDAPYLLLGLCTTQPDLLPLADRPDAWRVTDLNLDSDGAF